MQTSRSIKHLRLRFAPVGFASGLGVAAAAPDRSAYAGLSARV
ncbi:hypothetical protein [Azospirillum lipoferum]|nr:hypothetical protein [Azospirillum lipoferum]